MPKRAEASFAVTASPDEVAARLEAATRFRLMPAEARLIGRHDRPLAGIVRVDGFRVALNRRDPLTRLQAVAVGTVKETPGGSRVELVAGLPTWLTWLLRLSFVFGVMAAGGGAAMGLAQGDLSSAMVTVIAMGVFMLAATLGLGLNVANADKQVPELLAQVQAAVQAGPPPQPLQEAAPEADRRRARATARQHT